MQSSGESKVDSGNCFGLTGSHACYSHVSFDVLPFLDSDTFTGKVVAALRNEFWWTFSLNKVICISYFVRDSNL